MNESSIVVTDSINVEKTNVRSNTYLIVKRIFDVILSVIAFILLLPLFVIIGALIKLESKGNIFYKHKRIGKNGKYIYVYKFRTMYSDSKERLEELLKDPIILKEWNENFKLDNDPRITKIGNFLRKTSLDELPQLINIITGDMSIVGPRPIIDGEIDKYGKMKEKFLSVKPGLTGWWACNGRSQTNYADRIRLEMYYVNHQSIGLDLKIIFKTFISVIKRDGAK